MMNSYRDQLPSTSSGGNSRPSSTFGNMQSNRENVRNLAHLENWMGNNFSISSPVPSYAPSMMSHMTNMSGSRISLSSQMSQLTINTAFHCDDRMRAFTSSMASSKSSNNENANFPAWKLEFDNMLSHITGGLNPNHFMIFNEKHALDMIQCVSQFANKASQMITHFGGREKAIQTEAKILSKEKLYQFLQTVFCLIDSLCRSKLTYPVEDFLRRLLKALQYIFRALPSAEEFIDEEIARCWPNGGRPLKCIRSLISPEYSFWSEAVALFIILVDKGNIATGKFRPGEEFKRRFSIANDVRKKEVRNDTIIDRLVDVIFKDEYNNAGQLTALTCLSIFIRRSSICRERFQYEGIKRLIARNFLNIDTEEKILHMSLIILRAMSAGSTSSKSEESTERFKTEFVSDGGITRLAMLLSHASPRILVTAMECMSNCSNVNVIVHFRGAEILARQLSTIPMERSREELHNLIESLLNCLRFLTSQNDNSPTEEKNRAHAAIQQITKFSAGQNGVKFREILLHILSEMVDLRLHVLRLLNTLLDKDNRQMCNSFLHLKIKTGNEDFSLTSLLLRLSITGRLAKNHNDLTEAEKQLALRCFYLLVELIKRERDTNDDFFRLVLQELHNLRLPNVMVLLWWKDVPLRKWILLFLNELSVRKDGQMLIRMWSEAPGIRQYFEECLNQEHLRDLCYSLFQS